MGNYSPARAGFGFTLSPLGPEPASDRVNAARLGLHREFRRQIASTFHGAGWCAIPRWPRRSVPGPRERLGKFRAPCGRSPSSRRAATMDRLSRPPQRFPLCVRGPRKASDRENPLSLRWDHYGHASLVAASPTAVFCFTPAQYAREPPLSSRRGLRLASNFIGSAAGLSGLSPRGPLTGNPRGGGSFSNPPP